MISWYMMYSGGAESMEDPKVRRYSGVYMGKEGNSRDSAAMGVDLDCADQGSTDQRHTKESGLVGWKALKKHLKGT